MTAFTQSCRAAWPVAFAGVLVPLLAGSWPALAAELSGRLVEMGSRRPVDGALVRLIETGRRVTSDEEGRFVFGALAPGRYTVSTHHVAYADVERMVAVTERGNGAIELDLPPALYREDEVIVRSVRSSAAAGTDPYAADALTSVRLEQRPVTTVSDALARVPGLALVRDGAWATTVALRGMSRSNIVTLVDNTRIESAQDIAGAMSLVAVDDLERVEVMKSPGSVLFGSGSLGGAIHMMTRRAQLSDRAHGSAEWTEGATSADEGTSHHAAVEVADERQALRLSGGFRNAADVRTPRGELQGSQYHDWNLSGSLAMRTWGAQSLLATYQRVQAEDTGIPGGSPFAATASARFPLTRRELVGLEYTLPNPTPRLALLTARVSHQDIVRRVELIQSPTVTVTPHALHGTTSAQLESRWSLADDQTLVAGAEIWRRRLDSRRERRLAAQNRVIGERPVPASSFASGGLYVQQEWAPALSRARWVCGGRYDFGRTQNETTLHPVYVTTNGVTQTSPPGQVVLWRGRTTHDASWDASAGVHVEAHPRLALSLLGATAFRSPSLEERFQFLDLGGTNLHVGNPDLRPEHSMALDMGVKLRGDGGSLRADLFLQRLTDLVSELPGAFEGRGAYVKANIGRARLEGGEISAEQRLGPFATATASLAWVRGRDTRRDVELTQIPPASGRVELGLRAAGAGTVHVGATAERTQDRPGPGESVTPGWATWDARFASAPLVFGGRMLRLRTGVDNLFDRAYRRHLSTLRGALRLEPGRNAFISATLTL